MNKRSDTGQASPLKRTTFTPRPVSEKREAGRAEPIAITGLACRVPGADTADGFWQLLADKRDAVGEIPPHRWDNAAWYHPDPQMPGKLATRWGGVIAADGFDHDFFGISFEEARQMDPQQRIFLEVAWEALEDAGLTRGDLAGSQTGVFVGAVNYNGDYARHVFSDIQRINAFSGPGVANSVLSGRLAYLYDLKGPNITIDTACSSSLVALHLACQSLRQQECDRAIAGGVNIIIAPEFTLATSRMNLMAADGRCKPFDAAADGIVRSDGCGAVVLKRLSDAQRGEDRILAVIRGSAINQDGRTNGLTAPSGHAQTALIKQALARAQTAPEDIGYIEAHGTGTPLGDPIEIAAISAALGEQAERHPCYVGSVKGNVGHCEAAAGILSFIKVVLSLQRGVIPPQAHLSVINPHIDLSRRRVIFPQKMTPWPVANGLLQCAGVSSFGWSGTNAHAIVAAAPEGAVKERPRQTALVLPLSASGEPALRRQAGRFADLLAQQDSTQETASADLCYTAATARTHHPYRRAFVADNAAGLACAITRWLESGQTLVKHSPGGLALIFSGQGEQWPGMVDELMTCEPVFRQGMLRCDAEVRRLAGWSVLEAIRAGSSDDLSATAIAQPCIVSIQTSLFSMLTGWGIRPAAVAGHSVGEFSAACCGGVFSLVQTLAAVIARGRIMEAIRSDGKMLAVAAAEEQLRTLLKDCPGVTVAALNSPGSTVLSVDAAQADNLKTLLENAGLTFFPVNPHYAFHGPQIEKLSDPLSAAFTPLEPMDSHLIVASATRGEIVEGRCMDSRYWVANARQPVRFTAAIGCLLRAGIDDFLEIGPGATLTPHINNCLRKAGRQARAAGVLQRGRPQYQSLLDCAARLYSSGHDLDWRVVMKDRGNLVSLPPPPWRHTSCWLPLTPTAGQAASLAGEAQGPALEHLSFRAVWGAKAQPLLADHCMFGYLVVPGAVHIAVITTHLNRYLRTYDFTLANLVFIRPLILQSADSAIATLAFGPRRKDADAVDFTLDAADERGRGRLALSRGTINLGADGENPEPVQQCFKERVELLERQNVEDFYQRAHSSGLQLGPSFRWLTELWCDPAAGRACFTLGNEADDRADPYLALSPGLIDACFQALFAAFRRRFPHSDLFIPLSVDHLRIRQQMTAPLWGEATLTSSLKADVETLCGDIRLYTDGGTCVACFHRVTLKRVKAASLTPPFTDPSAALYRFEWAELPLRPVTAPRLKECTIIARDGADARAFAHAMTAAGVRATTLIHQGDALSTASLTALSGTVIYLAGCGDACESFTAREWLNHEMRAFGDLNRIADIAAQSAASRQLRVWAVTLSRSEEHCCDMGGAVLWGLGRTIAKEYPSIWGGMIALPVQALAGGGMEPLPALLASVARVPEYRLQADKVFGRKVILPPQDTAPRPLRRDGSYLITGGCGETGRLLAERLFSEGAGGVMLLGRSALTPELISLARDYKQRALHLRLFQGDVAHREDIDAAIRAMDRFMPPLAGVFHLAGVLDDAPLAKMNADRVRRVFQPKVCGAWNLHRATADRKLEIFALFSSLSSVIGTPGQGAYAAANAFIEALARYRIVKGLPAAAIAWGPWRGGMTTRLDPAHRRRFADAGLGLLDPGDVMAWSVRRQIQNAAHPIVADITAPDLEKLLGRGLTPQEIPGEITRRTQDTPDIVCTLAALPSPQARHVAVLQFLLREIGKMVTVGPLREDMPLHSLGLDSLTAVAIVQNIRSQTGLPIPIALLFDSDNVREAAVKLGCILWPDDK
ncbi:type I polyketide synthase [Sodalis sp. dw_96]|uniref:type I polyketide synthase n=1 Tax=Sodalis sp. dw_96 TaxID=2719794 RepID=UPI001BD54801|nr:type I polyketide synthase [Sodalis sp. dw_96]